MAGWEKKDLLILVTLFTKLTLSFLAAWFLLNIECFSITFSRCKSCILSVYDEVGVLVAG